jgi:ABC-type phosphate transport system permease subunit
VVVLLSFICKFTSAATFAFLFVACCTLVYLALPGLALKSFWIGGSWNPPTGEYSLVPMLWGTVLCATIGTLFSFPVALGLALGQRFLFSHRLSKILLFPIEFLSSFPSILFGLLGLTFIAPLVTQLLQTALPDTSPANLLSGGFTLALMTLPACLLTCQETLGHFSKHSLVNADALGMDRETIVLKLVLPALKSSLASCAFQTWSRGAGEAVALSMIIGRADLSWLVTSAPLEALQSPQTILSFPFFYMSPVNPGQTIATKLSGSELFLAWGNPPHQGAIMALALVLMIATVGVSLFFKETSKGSGK